MNTVKVRRVSVKGKRENNNNVPDTGLSSAAMPGKGNGLVLEESQDILMNYTFDLSLDDHMQAADNDQFYGTATPNGYDELNATND